MFAPKTEYHGDRRNIVIFFDRADEKQTRALGFFRAAFGYRAQTEHLDERFAVLRLYPVVPEVQA